jgi:hypothetical protein
MNFKKASLLVFCALLMGVLVPATGALAGESIFIDEPNFYSVPKTIMVPEGPSFTPDFRENPALMATDKDVRFLMDLHYTGGYSRVNLDSFFTIGQTGVPVYGFGYGSGEERYVTNGVGTDLGVVLKVTDRSHLGVLLNYRYLESYMDGDMQYGMFIAGLGSTFSASLNRTIRTSDFSFGLLYDIELSRAFTLGMGLRYGYENTRSEFGLSGSGTSNFLSPETISMDRNLTLDYHRIAPVMGISLKPIDALTIDASVEAGFLFGGVDKSGTLYNGLIAIAPIYKPYVESLHSRDLSGWDIESAVDVTYAVSDRLSLPFFVDFAYADTSWEVDGTATGAFFSYALPELTYMPGPISYDNKNILWDICAGLGAEFNVGGWDMKLTGAYTHWESRNRYIETNVNNLLFLVVPGTVAAFKEDAVERRDIMSLAIVMKKEFTPSLAAELGLRYDLGWGKMDLERHLRGGFDYLFVPTPVLTMAYSGRDIYQDLTLTARMNYRPSDRLTLSFGGNVTFPIDPLGYKLDGSPSGLPVGIASMFFPRMLFNGASELDSVTTGWQYGGYFMLTYELGAPKPVPPAPAPAPIIEPKLEPMSYK